MTLFSPDENEGVTPLTHTDVNALLDKQQNGFTIEKMVKDNGLTYLEATVQWLEENSIPEGTHTRYIPTVIIDNIKEEAIKDNLLRPSLVKKTKTNTLDFLM